MKTNIFEAFKYHEIPYCTNY